MPPQIHVKAEAARINLRKIDATSVGISLDETTTRDEVDRAGRSVRRADRRHRRARCGDRRRPARRAAAQVEIPAAPGVQHPPQRTRTAALHARAGRQGPGDGSHHDPAGQLHDEAQRHRRDDPGDLARVRQHPSARAGRAGAGLQAADRRAGSDAGRMHRLRRGQPAAELRRAGRIRRPAGDPRLPPLARRRPSRHLPDPRIRARHQPGVGADVRHERGGHQVRRQRQRRRRGHPRQGGEVFRPPRRADDHLPVHARRVRGRRGRDLRDRARARRPGVHRRRQHECPGRRRQARQVGLGRLPPQPAQDLLHPARRRRPRRRPVRGEVAPRAVPAARAAAAKATSAWSVGGDLRLRQRSCRSAGCTSP